MIFSLFLTYQIWQTAIAAAGVYFILTLFIRMVGLRSFSKMSGNDFVVTIAIGALAASAILGNKETIVPACIAIAVLFILQILMNLLRNKNAFFTKFFDNSPLLLMSGSKILDGNLRKARISRKELRYKLREANVTQLSQVKAAVLETTGDVTVLHHQDINHTLDEEILKDVNEGTLNVE